MNIMVQYKRLFTIVNVLVVSGVIALYHTGVLIDTSFVLFLTLCLALCGLALCRPFLSFALFVGLLPLEIISVAPESLGFSLRPYQVIAIAMLLGMIGALIFKDLYKKKMFTWNIFDSIVSVLLVSGLVSGLINISTAHVWMQTVIFLSFGLLYFVTRFFVQEKEEIVALLPIMISSGIVVSVYAVVQNILFAHSKYHLEVMPGRPNATFTEPDWLGLYLVFVFAMCITYLYYNIYHKHIWKFFDIALYASTTVVSVALILTVARSAWIGVLLVAFIYFVLLIAQRKYKIFARHFLWLTSIGILSVGIVVLSDLTTFELGNRIHSTASGKQEITVACPSQSTRDTLMSLGEITNVQDLQKYDCEHIDLEEINIYERAGAYVFTVKRDDPTIVTRGDVYIAAWDAFLQRPIFGHGWGRSASILGVDISGTPLNASNIFLEIMIAMGSFGLGAFLVLLALIAFSSIRVLRASCSMLHMTIAIYGLLGLCAIIVPNMFNAGLLIGFVWVYLGTVAILRKSV